MGKQLVSDDLWEIVEPLLPKERSKPKGGRRLGAATQGAAGRRIARRGIESSERLGRHRWIVERTLAWLSKYRRLTIRYERRADIHLALLHLGCSLVCLNFLK